ncbi:Ribosomal proteins 50S L24/mitochondrial 39S L24 [Arabidopsis thaliana x Arabidopsis arenosa]|uniref:Ribosomal proteins 50S L24/mitochondrial 39S L24 n=1 Tax=Arabidopsis thaliana x Arabidopsis arenosa TaxID=1240361 RepID=A0A8T1XIV3_9BRAS|nr:Ribosomal proteins 50S L24/mitochondrial 39S L24 [Arabidopsis thaliana x Arabidopsis arenosa]
MATMSALQSSFTSLSLSSNSSFLGQRLISPISLSVASPVKPTENPCLVLAKLKRWERKECKPNSLPILHKMHVKFGDTVKVISGRDKGKIGEVTKIFTHNSTIVIKDVNLKTKHMKSREEGEPGQIVKIEAPIHSSNVMLYSKEKDVVSRVGHKVLEDGQKVRYLIKTGELIDTIEKWKQLKEAKDKETTQVAVASAS